MSPPISKRLAEQYELEIQQFILDGYSPPGRSPKRGPCGKKVGAVRMWLDKHEISVGAQRSRLLAIERSLGRSIDWSCGGRVDEDGNPEGDFSVEKLPGYQADADEIIARRKHEYERRHKAKAARKLINVKVRIDGPYGVLHMGDPHLDDPGTDIKLIEHDIGLIRDTKGLFGSCVGDYINNWKGRLQFLHSMQSTTQMEAWKLVEWFVQSVDWLYLIGGNHDVWSGSEDPLVWFTSGSSSIYEWHGARMALKPPKGQEIRINARHEWPGSSVYNRAQGATKAIRFLSEDHLYINGHKHEWAHYEEENPQKQMVCHAVQVGAYKKIDDFADKKGYVANDYGHSCITVFNPLARHPCGVTHVFFDCEEGAEYLKWLRRKHD